MRSLLVLLAMLGFASPAFAYVDPGTGMLAIQGLIALVIGVVAFVRHPIQTLGHWWRRLRGKNNDDA
jgi:membrane-bound ClpP family serine protease